MAEDVLLKIRNENFARTRVLIIVKHLVSSAVGLDEGAMKAIERALQEHPRGTLIYDLLKAMVNLGHLYFEMTEVTDA
jgi:hypothetical protein